jgi:signal transduction histidine kinase
MRVREWFRSLRVQLAVAGFVAIYLPVLALFVVTYLSVDESVDTVDGVETTARTSGSGPGWVELAVLLLAPVAALLAWWWAGRAVRPFDRIRSVAEHIEASDLDQRIGLRSGSTELVSLASSFDAMLDRLHDAAARQRQVIDEISHELRTPIAVLITNADVRLAQQDRSAAWYREGLEQSGRTAHRMRTILERLLVDARSYAHTTDRHPADLMEVVRAVATEIGVVAGARDVDVRVAGPASALGSWDTATCARAVLNLLDNAVRHSSPGGAVRVVVRTDDDGVSVSVSDDGPGIPAERAEEIFERSWRGDPDTGEGRGLGLAIARQVAQAHGGDVSVRSPDPDGHATTFVLTLRG